MNRLFLITLLILIFIVPACYATDNQTDSVIEIQNDNVLAANNDYYFNSSLENDDGDGSFQNPYKHLTSDRIKGNCNIYLADGIYELDNKKTIERVHIIGNSPEKTIINMTVSDLKLTHI